MKKLISFALIVALVASAAFAGFSGNATVKVSYDTTKEAYGVANSTAPVAEIELAADTKEAVGEGDIYAGIKATMSLAVKESKKDDKHVNIYNKGGQLEGVGLWLAVSDAYVAGEGWTVSILKGHDAPDYAKSAIDTHKDDVKDAFGCAYDTKDVADTYSAPAWNDGGVTATVAGYTVAAGFKGDKNGELDLEVAKQYTATPDKAYNAFNVFAETKEFEFDAVKVQAAAIVASNGTKNADKKYTSLDKSVLAVSGKVAYATDAFAVKAAADVAVEDLAKFEGKKVDAAVNVAVAPATIDVYYAGNVVKDTKHYISAQAKVDLASFEVPVALTVAVKDITGKLNGSVKAEVKIDEALSCDATVGYVFNGKKTATANDLQKLSVSANVKYAPEAFTAKAGVSFSKCLSTEKTSILSATASVETTKLVNGATLALEYGKAAKADTLNFLDDNAAVGGAKKNLGAVTASCKIAF